MDKHACCGCGACISVCPVNCISMKADAEGFLYPKIETDSCINCNTCRAVCPMPSAVSTSSQPQHIYACQLKASEERKRSSSGGIFYAIAKWIIQNSGIVYGAAFDNKLKLRHTTATTLEELEALRGSKYIQSEISDVTFKEIKAHLQAQRWCYFVGTGCQVAALKSFISKDKQHPYLITSDIICHGVPSQWLFDTHIRHLEKQRGSKVTQYQFRDNSQWGGAEIVDYENGERSTLPSYSLSPYLYAFMNGFVSRESCYECPFATQHRVSDITLGDFWGGAKLFKTLDATTGISFCAVNTEQGANMWQNIVKDIDYVETDILAAIPNNSNLVRPTPRPIIRDSIFETIRTKGYDYTAKTAFKPQNYMKLRIIYFFLRFSFIKRIKNLLQAAL
ncbi:MAG: Coenzyme F420 hydrogenase/dehydrogenase, beta subunit C-terminal domain [Paludibacteraceae bacterium]|nr:Coenzyme F420 hydrogenase/dehydrogenase, beta subunit C-terminal domain [Paludibacteraceae bacterium]